VSLFRGDKLIARWEEGTWPEPGFYDILNTEVKRCEVASDRLIVFQFDNGRVASTAAASQSLEGLMRLAP